MGNLANKIKDAAKGKGMNITELANALGVKQPQLSRTINNPRITLDDMEKIAQAIGCKISDFIEEPTNEIYCPYCGRRIKFSKDDGSGESKL